MRALIDKLAETHALSFDEWVRVIGHPELFAETQPRACALRDDIFGKNVFVRGLLEFISHCQKDCLYCGLRKSNPDAVRYRLSEEEILSSAESAWRTGFRTIVLQGGEDAYYTDARMVALVKSLKNAFPDLCVTLSIGEKPFSAYAAYKKAGAERYLLRHESASCAHYARLHPSWQTLNSRIRCLYDLKRLNYQTGAGFMVGSPFQTDEDLARDMLFLKKLSPEMIGIGPFIPHKDTPFRDKPPGDLKKTLYLLSLIRLMLPDVLLPATTALGALDDRGREHGILAGGNVLMPNITPKRERKNYSLYNNKPLSGLEDGAHLADLRKRFAALGYALPVDKGDAPGFH